MTDDYIHHLRHAAVALHKYASLDGTEIGELGLALIQLSRCVDYVSEEFAAALLVEMEEQLLNFQENARIVEREETFTRTVVSLEWE